MTQEALYSIFKKVSKETLKPVSPYSFSGI